MVMLASEIKLKKKQVTVSVTYVCMCIYVCVGLYLCVYEYESVCIYNEYMRLGFFSKMAVGRERIIEAHCFGSNTYIKLTNVCVWVYACVYVCMCVYVCV